MSNEVISYPLASLQPAMLVNHLRAPRSGVDLVQMMSTLHEPIDVDRLRQAWEEVSARHDALRTAFRWEGITEPRQEVHAVAPPPVAVLDWSDARGDAIDARLRAFLAADRTAGFDLRVPPLQRVTLMRIAESDWRMVWTFNHILMDGRSFAIVLREMFALYDGAAAGQALLSSPARPYRDFVHWFTLQDFSSAEPFWREQMRGLPGPTPLPVGFLDSRDGESRRGRGLHHMWLAKEPSAALETLARENGLTINNIIQGAWALLLAHHSGEDDVVFGATRACRKGTIAGADDIVGLFINTVPVRARVRPDMPLVAWLGELRESWRSLFAVEHTPLRLVQRWSEMGMSSPLFNSQIVFESLPLEATMHAIEPSLSKRGFKLYGGTNFPLTGLLYGGERFSLEIENDREVIDDETALRLLAQLAALLESMATNPAALVGELSLLPASERTLVVDEWNRTAVEFPAEATLVSLLRDQARRTPDAIAVKDERAALTYAALDARASALARRLRAAGVMRGSLVAVCAERSRELVVALVAILKAGGAYVPLDPEYPGDRLAFMLEDAAAPVLLAQRHVSNVLPPHSATTIWLDDVLLENNEGGSIDDVIVTPDDLAYMIYTSGSTGRPKGALNAHRGIVNRLLWMQVEYQLGPADVVLQKTPFSFDVSVWEFFWPLMTGATLVMARPGGHRDTLYLAEALQRHGVTVCHFVPSMLRAFLADPAARGCTTLRDVMASGEALSPDLVAAFATTLPGARLHNLYGPTECAVDVSYWPCPREPAGLTVVPIGRPVANTQLYVLNSRMQPVPIGVPGELYLGGVQVGRGYHNRPELTTERFVPDRFAADPTARLYRTGDRARWRADGTVEYLGRLDFQVKIRGFRIELGEIESALFAHPSIHDVVVVAHGEGVERRLVAYCVAVDEAPSVGILRDHLAHALPDYMVPAIFVWLPALPLSSNGKVDRRALPAPEIERQALSRAFVAPRTPEERLLADIWRRVLRVSQVGVEDNFFELGGDSLLGVQILARAALGGLRLTLTQLLRYPTISSLATVAHLAQAPQVQSEVRGAVSLTPVQQWFFESQREGLHYWNQALLFTVPPDLDVGALTDALAAVIHHHDSFRLRFARETGAWTQTLVAEGATPELVISNLANVPEKARDEMMAEACRRVQSSLDLESGPLLRVGLFRLGHGEPGRLLIAVHHLAIDGVSWRILREDLETAYLQRLRGDAIFLPARTTPFSAWATGLAEPAVRDAMRGDLSYWEGVGSLESLRLPCEQPDNDEQVAADTDTVVVRLDETETRTLFQAVPQAYNTQINDVLLAALADAFGGWLGGGDLVVNVEGHGREDVVKDADVSRTIGWFTTIFPIRLRLHAASVMQRIKETKELLRAAPRRGLSYGILRYLDGAETLRAQTTPKIVFNYMGQFDQVVSGSSLFGFAREFTGSWYGARTRRPHLMEVNALVLDGRLELRWSYSTRSHDRATIAQLAEAYLGALRGIVAHCTTAGVGGSTPSDFPLANLDSATVDQLVAGGRDVEDIYPLTPMQELFMGTTDPGTDPGFEQWRYRLTGPLDVAALRAAWELVTARHAMLRTAFISEGVPAPLQVVRSAVTLPWAEHDWRGFSRDEQALRMGPLLATDRAAGFAVDCAPLMRITLVRFSDNDYELVWSNHHLLLDRWSWPLILLEIARAYPAIVAGERPELEGAPRFSDFVAWQQSQSLDAAREFWARHFTGFDAPPRLAMTRVDAEDAESSEVRVRMSREETRALRAFARAHQLATNAVIEGAWALCLARRSGHDDVSFGVAVAGRDAAIPGIERLVGLTLNNLPLRARVDPTAPVKAWLGKLHDAQTELQQFAHVPLAAIQEWSRVPWRTRLFETLLVFQHDDAEEMTRSWLGAGMTTTLVHVPTRTAYPLSVMIAGRDELEFRVTFDARYFDEAAALGMAEGLRRAMLAMMAEPKAPVASVLAALPESTPAVTAPAVGSHEFAAPRSATESVLARIWGEVLGVEHVGIHDNFFVLGGYSLVATQIVSRMRTTLKIDAPVRLLFQHPTVAELAIALAGRDRKPGQLERIAQLVQRVQGMSLDELRRAGAARAATN